MDVFNREKKCFFALANMPDDVIGSIRIRRGAKRNLMLRYLIEAYLMDYDSLKDRIEEVIHTSQNDKKYDSMRVYRVILSHMRDHGNDVLNDIIDECEKKHQFETLASLYDDLGRNLEDMWPEGYDMPPPPYKGCTMAEVMNIDFDTSIRLHELSCEIYDEENDD